MPVVKTSQDFWLTYDPDHPEEILVATIENFINDQPIKNWHSHKKLRLVYCLEGGIQLNSFNQELVISGNMLAIIPAGMEHFNASPSIISICNIYIHPNKVKHDPEKIIVLKMTPLSKELIHKLGDEDLYTTDQAIYNKICDVLIYELNTLDTMPMSACVPFNSKLKRAYDYIVGSDSLPSLSLYDIADHIGVSDRHFTRLLRKEIGLTFVQWKQQLLFIKATQLLMDGYKVMQVSEMLGYSSQSGFSDMFYKISGYKPTEYCEKFSR